MHPELRNFLAQLAGAIALTLVPVVLTAFMGMPLTLQYHPGEMAGSAARVLHMT